MNARRELDNVRAELSRLHKLKRETQWRSEAYRCGVRIVELKQRRKELRQIVRRALCQN